MIEVEWDEAKRLWTIANRGIDFDELRDVFLDPARLETEDMRRDYGEPRWVLLSPVGGRLLHVTFTIRGERRRIISARRASIREQRLYARERQN
jgi:uncharacterized protein